jgi:hypothetical protein
MSSERPFKCAGLSAFNWSASGRRRRERRASPSLSVNTPAITRVAATNNHTMMGSSASGPKESMAFLRVSLNCVMAKKMPPRTSNAPRIGFIISPTVRFGSFIAVHQVRLSAWQLTKPREVDLVIVMISTQVLRENSIQGVIRPGRGNRRRVESCRTN